MLKMIDNERRALHPVTSIAIEGALDEVKTLLEIYIHNPSHDICLLLQQARANLSKMLGRLSEEDLMLLYDQSVFDVMHILLRNGFYGSALIAVPHLSNETILIASVTDQTRNEPKSIALKKSFVIGAMYLHPFRIPNVLSLLGESGAFLTDLICCVCRSPKVFQNEDDQNEYLKFLEILLSKSAASLKSPSTRISAGNVASSIAKMLSLHTIYSSEACLRDLQAMKAQFYEKLITQIHGTDLDAVLPPPDTSRGRIRIGFLWHDGDARTETFVGLAHLRGLNRSLFEVHSLFFSSSYAKATAHNSIVQDIDAHSDLVSHIGGQSMRGMVDAVRNADLDLLFIVNNITWGWSDYICLSAHRLARVQIVNYCAVTTTGFRNIDVWLSAEKSEIADGAEEHYTEALVRMPGSVLCFDRLEFPVITDKTVARLALGIPEPALLFVSGANFYKLTPALTATWAEILARRLDAHLVLYPMNPNWDSRYPLSMLRQRLARQLRERGVPTDRIHIVGPWQDHESVFALLNNCDVYLDSFPHAGGISTLDALLIGLPTVTLRGRFQHGIQGANALEAIGLDEWIVETRDAYVEKALMLADDPSLRAELHLKILERLPKSVLLDVEAFGIKLSDTLCDVYRRFAVNRLAGQNDAAVSRVRKNAGVI